MSLNNMVAFFLQLLYNDIIEIERKVIFDHSILF